MTANSNGNLGGIERREIIDQAVQEIILISRQSNNDRLDRTILWYAIVEFLKIATHEKVRWSDSQVDDPQQRRKRVRGIRIDGTLLAILRDRACMSQQELADEVMRRSGQRFNVRSLRRYEGSENADPKCLFAILDILHGELGVDIPKRLLVLAADNGSGPGKKLQAEAPEQPTGWTIPEHAFKVNARAVLFDLVKAFEDVVSNSRARESIGRCVRRMVDACVLLNPDCLDRSLVKYAYIMLLDSFARADMDGIIRGSTRQGGPGRPGGIPVWGWALRWLRDRKQMTQRELAQAVMELLGCKAGAFDVRTLQRYENSATACPQYLKATADVLSAKFGFPIHISFLMR